MNYDNVMCETDGELLLVTLDRPGRHNAMTQQMRIDLLDCVRRAESDDGIHAIVFTGYGTKAFCAGANIADLEERTLTLLDTKNNKPFLIPIPNYLHKVLKVRIKANDGSKYIFPSRMKGRHITEPQSGINAVIKTSKVEFCSHDLRRLFVTTAEALDLSPFVIKRLVNHAIGSDTTSGYIVSDLERLRGPIQKIEDKILSLAKAKEPGKVFTLKTG